MGKRITTIWTCDFCGKEKPEKGGGDFNPSRWNYIVIGGRLDEKESYLGCGSCTKKVLEALKGLKVRGEGDGKTKLAGKRKRD